MHTSKVHLVFMRKGSKINIKYKQKCLIKSHLTAKLSFLCYKHLVKRKQRVVFLRE